MGAPSIESTWFDARWEEFACKQRLPDVRARPLSETTVGVVELRKWALEFFSWGVVHQAVAQRRWEELFAADAEASG